MDLIAQDDSLRTTNLSPCEITEANVPHDGSIKFKERFYNSEFNTSECCGDEKLLGRCHNALDEMELLRKIKAHPK